MKAIRIVTIAAALALSGGTSHAVDYPTKPIRLLVPFGPGSGTDVTARVLTTAMGEALKAQFVV